MSFCVRSKLIRITKQSIVAASLSTFQKDGDANEIQYGSLVVPYFPLCERMWATLVVPATNRILNNINPQIRIRPRNNVDNRIQDIGSIHYSMFLNLIYANHCLSGKHISFFENFYAHLGSAFDLAEEFIIQLYFLFLHIEDKKPKILSKLNMFQFLMIAYKWYKKNYKTTYQHYLIKGKHAPVHLISRADILKDYLGKTKERKAYVRQSQKIRTYRNIIVHNIQIGSLNIGGQYYVPKKEKILDYKAWRKVFSVVPSSIEFKNNFVNRNQQMQNDYIESLKILNDLWKKPLSDFQAYFHIKANVILQGLYDLTFV